MDWGNLIRYRVSLAMPLMFIRAPEGVLTCGYFDRRAFDHHAFPMAGVVVRGVHSFEEMLERAAAEEEDISRQARELGVQPGMKGREILLRFGGRWGTRAAPQ